MPKTWIAAINSDLSPPASGLSSLLQQQRAVDRWFVEQEQETPLPPYASVDLRYAGYKLAPIDTNLFPAGFNNISPNDYPYAIAAFAHLLETQQLPRTLLLLAESHSRNLHYW